MISGGQVAAARRRAGTFLTATIRIERATGAATFDSTTGTLTAGATTVVYDGPASLSTRTMTRGQVDWGGQTVQAGQVLVRAPLDAQTVQPGDEVVVVDPGDFPGTDDAELWVHEVPGRQVAVLARIICAHTKPGDDGG